MRTISVPLIAAARAGRPRLRRAGVARAQAGSDLWLRYDPIADEAARSAYRRAVSAIVAPSDTATGRIVKAELQRGLRGLLGAEVPAHRRGRPARAPSSSARRARRLSSPRSAGPRRSTAPATRATSSARRRSAGTRPPSSRRDGEAGALYGAFHFLRLIQTRQPIRAARHRRAAAPRAAAAEPLGQPRRHHRARLRGRVALELGRAARTRRSAHRRLRPRQRVDRHQRHGAQQRQREPRVAVAARISRRRPPSPASLRPYGIRVYLVRELRRAHARSGGLPTADPLDPAVARWWRDEGRRDLPA